MLYLFFFCDLYKTKRKNYNLLFTGKYVPDYFLAGTSNILESQLVVWQLVDCLLHLTDYNMQDKWTM